MYIQPLGNELTDRQKLEYLFSKTVTFAARQVKKKYIVRDSVEIALGLLIHLHKLSKYENLTKNN